MPGSESGHGGTMNFPPVNHLSRDNQTLRQLEDAVDPGLWEPQTIIVVVIFGLVCLLHLTAFLYTVCLQSYVNAGTQAFTHPMRKDGESKTFYRFMSHLLIDHPDPQEKERTPIMINM